MGEVEPQFTVANVGSSLDDVFAKHTAQCRVQQVRCRMVARDARSALFIYDEAALFTECKRPFFELYVMDEDTVLVLLDIQYLCFTVTREVLDHSRIRNLSTSLSIEYSLIKSYVFYRILFYVNNLCICFSGLIAEKESWLS